jgi:hypothetical protein
MDSDPLRLVRIMDAKVNTLNVSLMHVGIKGMHWGVRKDEGGGNSGGSSNSSGATSPKGSKSTSTPEVKKANTGGMSEDYAKIVTIKKKKLSELSNADIQALTARMELEKKYSDMNQTSIDKGKKIAKDLLVAQGTAEAKRLLPLLTAFLLKKMGVDYSDPFKQALDAKVAVTVDKGAAKVAEAVKEAKSNSTTPTSSSTSNSSSTSTPHSSQPEVLRGTVVDSPKQNSSSSHNSQRGHSVWDVVDAVYVPPSNSNSTIFGGSQSYDPRPAQRLASGINQQVLLLGAGSNDTRLAIR